jgi:cation transport ATPase
MFSTSSLYFLVAIFGESIETGKTHGLQLVEEQERESAESGHDENQEETLRENHNESSESQEQRLQEGALEHNANESKHFDAKETEETLHKESSENQRRAIELPLSISAGVGYAAVGLWMILDKRNSKIPYLIAIIGSLVLLGIYFASRTVGITSLGTEPIGLLDAIVAGLQVAIIAISLYILFGKIYIKGITVDK